MLKFVFFLVWIITLANIFMQNRTYNTALPFGCEGISQIMRQEIFATKGGANIEVFQDIVRAGRIRSPSIALMLTVVCWILLCLY